MSDEAAPISGSIDPNTFPLVLMSLHRNGVTGSLRVEGPTYNKALYFRGGRVLFGSSNDPRDELGAILIGAGKLSAEQLGEVKSRVGPGNPLAKALQDSGFVSQREIGEAARGKVEQILADVLGYEAGSFEFEDGVLPKGAIDLKLSTPRLVLAAARRAADRAFVLRHLGSLDAVLGRGATEAGEITSEAGPLLPLLDGTRTLKDAAARASIDEFEAAKTACGLLFLGVLEKRGGAAPGIADGAPLDLNVGAEEANLFVAPEPPRRESANETMMLPSGFSFVRPAELGGEEAAEPSLEATLDATFSRLSSADIQKSFAAMREGGPGAEPGSAPAVPELAPPEPAAPAAPAASRASTRDLAAIGNLLEDKPATEGPLTPFERRTWEPEFPAGTQEKVPPNRGKRPSSSVPVKPLALGAVLVVAAGASWYFLAGPGRAPASPPPSVAAATPARTPAEPAPATTMPAPVAAVPPTEVGAAGAPPPSTAMGAPAAANPAPKERPVVAAPAAPVTTSPAKPGPSAQKPPAGAGRPAGWANASTSLRRGEFDGAARAFAEAARSSGRSWTTQLLVACSTETLAKAAAAVPSEDLFVVPVRYQGRDCYRVLFGLTDTEAQAEAQSIPSYFKAGGASPKAVPLRSALP